MRKNNKKNKYPQISARFYLKNGKVRIMRRITNSKRLYYKIRHAQFLKVYFKVEYGKIETRHGKEMAYNDGTYTDRKEATEVLKAFLE